MPVPPFPTPKVPENDVAVTEPPVMVAPEIVPPVHDEPLISAPERLSIFCESAIWFCRPPTPGGVETGTEDPEAEVNPYIIPVSLLPKK